MTKDNDKQNLKKKLVENGPIILDGATGTNLQKAGMLVLACAPDQWILENPDIMIKLQEDYGGGTDILYAPTFLQTV